MAISRITKIKKNLLEVIELEILIATLCAIIWFTTFINMVLK